MPQRHAGHVGKGAGLIWCGCPLVTHAQNIPSPRNQHGSPRNQPGSPLGRPGSPLGRPGSPPRQPDGPPRRPHSSESRGSSQLWTKLLGDQSLAELEAMAQMVYYGSTSLIEERHAGCKRDAPGREATALPDSDEAAAAAAAENKEVTKGQHKGAGRSSRRPHNKKCLPITRCNARMAAHVIRRRITRSAIPPGHAGSSCQDPIHYPRQGHGVGQADTGKQETKENQLALRKQRVECHRGQQPWATVARTPRFCEAAGSWRDTRKMATLGRVEPIRRLVT